MADPGLVPRRPRLLDEGLPIALPELERVLARAQPNPFGDEEHALTRILHYGDSHVAADILSGALRRRLQLDFGDAGVGFVLPGRFTADSTIEFDAPPFPPSGCNGYRNSSSG